MEARDDASRRPPGRYLNWCRGCERDFASERAFDKHRVGRHEYLYDEQHPDGRRCLRDEELRGAGLSLDKRGRWTETRRGGVAARDVPRGSGQH